jgi:hypothetical protein
MKLSFTQQGIHTIDDYVSSSINLTTHASRVAIIRKVGTLLRHLECHVDNKVQWVTFSHLTVFYLTDSNTWFHHKARVFVSAGPDDFQIEYRSAKEIDYDNSYTTLEAHSIEEAVELIFQSLELAETDLPERPGWRE